MADQARNPHARTWDVVWQEGMLLSPQHFQQMERAHHRRLAERFDFRGPHGWGLHALEIDEQALMHGRLSLLAVAGVFPDGTPFSSRLGDPLPEPRDLTSWFSGPRDRVEVHLGLPIPRPGEPMTAEQAGTAVPGPRYLLRREVIEDEHAEGIDRDLALARRNLVLLLPDEALSQHDRLRLCEVVRTSGGFAVRDQFGGVEEPYVPPVIALEASRSLHALVRRIHNLLLDKSRELSDMRTQRGGFASFAATDAGSFTMLHTVNAHIPVVQSFANNGRVHPEAVHLALARLAGELCTFSSTRSPRDIPDYDHENLGGCFAKLAEILDELLRARAQINALRIDLSSRPGSVFVGAIAQPKLLDARGHLYLGVQVDGMDRQALMTSFPAKVKIASDATVQKLVMAALPGLSLLPPAPVPAGVPNWPGLEYFELDRTHQFWEDIRRAANVAIYMPPDFKGARLDLVGNWE